MRWINSFLMSVALLLGLSLLLIGLVPVYDGLQQWTEVEKTSGYDKVFLHQANVAMRDYLYGYQEHLLIEKDGKSLFGAQEVFHMAEVRRLFTRLARFALVLFILALFLSHLFKTRVLRDQLFTAIGLLSFLGLAGIFFEEAFVLMHRVFFDNDLWLFPPQSPLIRLLPEAFFYSFTLLILFSYSVLCFILYGVERIYHDFASGSRQQK